MSRFLRSACSGFRVFNKALQGPAFHSLQPFLGFDRLGVKGSEKASGFLGFKTS